MATNDSGSGNILLAFLLGAAAGAAVALLYTPQSGEKTRRILGEKAREGRQKAAEFAEKAADTFAQGREQVASAIDRGRDAYTQVRESL